MIFKDLRYIIYSNLELVIGNEHLTNVQANFSCLDKYDYYEVIGIRSSIQDNQLNLYKKSGWYPESYIIVSLKKPAVQTINNVTDYVNAINNENINISEAKN